ncbi:Uncharacterised protein [Mycobacteroides abscessus subsp. abscessus]|nr:Uncharacterised protein [Mycobacteroides abscessus subsp. abscessus]
MDPVVPVLGAGPAHPHVPVGQGQQGLAVGLVLGVEAAVDQLPGVGAVQAEVQLGDVVVHDVGPGLLQIGPVPVPVDPDDQPEAPGLAGLHPGDRILDDHGVGGVHLQGAGGGQEHVRGGLAGDAVLQGVAAVDDDGEEVLQPGRGQHGAGVAGGGDQGDAGAALLHAAGEVHGAAEGLHAVLIQLGLEVVVLQGGLPVHGPGAGGIALGALGQGGPAGGQQLAHPVLAGAPVHVGPVVPRDGELPTVDILGAAALGRLQAGIGQDRVEQLLPGGGVHRGGVGDHPVHVEDDGLLGTQHGELRLLLRGSAGAGHVGIAGAQVQQVGGAEEVQGVHGDLSRG